jgi:outer membrane protein assembly factor BamA
MSDLDVTQIHVSESNLADSSSSDGKTSVPPRKVTVSHLNRKFRDLQSKCEFQQTDMLMWLKADKDERDARDAAREAKEEERLKREAIEKSERELREATEKQEQARREAEARMMHSSNGRNWIVFVISSGPKWKIRTERLVIWNSVFRNLKVIW